MAKHCDNIEQEQPDFVVLEIEAITTDQLLAIESDKITTVIPKARTTQLTLNREGIRCLASEQLGINNDDKK